MVQLRGVADFGDALSNDSRDMVDKVIKLGNLIPEGQVFYEKRHVIIWPKGCANTLTAAMGMGGGIYSTLGCD